MIVSHALHSLDADQLADGSRIQQLFQLPEKGAVPQHMADGQNASGLFRRLPHGENFAFIGRHGLFAQHMVALFQGRQHRLVVHPVLGADQRGVRQPGLGQQVLPGAEHPFRRQAVIRGKLFPAGGIGFGHGDDFQFLGVVQGVHGVGFHAPQARAGHNGSNFLHLRLFSFRFQRRRSACASALRSLALGLTHTGKAVSVSMGTSLRESP